MGAVARNYRDSKHGTVGLKCEDPSLAVQASKDECDINVIVKRYLKTGVLPQVAQGAYLDISHMTNLQDALNMVMDAEEAFLALPAEVRKRFNNDPTELVAFAADRNNLKEAIALGLVDPSKAPPSSTPPSAPGGQPGTAPSGQPSPKSAVADPNNTTT